MAFDNQSYRQNAVIDCVDSLLNVDAATMTSIGIIMVSVKLNTDPYSPFL